MSDQTGGPPAPPTFLQKLQFRPGVNRESTFYANAGGFWNSSRVRFRQGHPESIGGWQKNSRNTFQGTCRSLFAWSDLGSDSLIGIGTSWKYYVQNGGSYYDITPLRTPTAAIGTNPFASTSGSKIVTVTHTNHGAQVNDFVTYSGATTFGGIPAGDLNQEHQVLSVPNSGSYTIQVNTAATSTATGGGTVTAEYQINTGLNTVVLSSGWGAGPFGMGGFGLSSDVFVSSQQLRLWSVDQFGEDIVLNPRDGGIFYWQRSLGFSHRGVALGDLSGASDTPLMASQIVVSANDRSVIAFGCNALGDTAQDRLLIRWCNQEDPTNWTPSNDTTAGDLRIGMGSSILRALKAKQEILVFTDISVHSLQWLGAPYFFGLQTVSANASLVAPNAVVDTGDVVLWMGVDNFYAYTGRVEAIPCTLREYVFSDINSFQTHKIFAATNKIFNEATWFYCSSNSDECDRYITFNYADNLWYAGELSRTAWLDQGLFRYPLAASPDGYLYEHEFESSDGEQNPPVSIGAWIETSPMEIGQGDNFMLVRRILPDLNFTGSTTANPSLNMTITGYTYPGGSYIPSVSGTVTRTAQLELDQFTSNVPMRIRARSVAFKFSCDDPGVKWRLGDMRIELRPDGKR